MSGSASLSGNRERPRVVVADDHTAVRHVIEEVLSSSFDVVAAVSDGRQAVEAAQQLNPDVVVLDITMPGLDGFGAVRELVGRGTRAKLVFLSVHDGDEYVAAAVDLGVQGYVVKSRLATDLEDAVRHVLEGRLWLPTSSSLLGLTDPRARHAVHFAADPDARLGELQRFAARALRHGDAVVAVGRSALLDGLTSCLADEGFDPGALAARGRYMALDAEACLSRIMRGDEPDEAALVGLLCTLEDAHAASDDGGASDLVVFGEVAPLLLRDGNVRGALTIERIWHSHSGRFRTLCSYCSADTKGSDWRDAVGPLHGLHQAVSG